MSRRWEVTDEEHDVMVYALKWTLEHNLYVGLTLKGHHHTMEEHLRNLLGIYDRDEE